MIKISKTISNLRKEAQNKALKNATTEKFLEIIQNLDVTLKSAFEAQNLTKSSTSSVTPTESMFQLVLNKTNAYNFESTLLTKDNYLSNIKSAINLVRDSIKDIMSSNESFNYQRLSALSKSTSTDEATFNVNGVSVDDLIKACESTGAIETNGCEFYVKNFNLFLTGVSDVKSDAQKALAFSPDNNATLFIITTEVVGQFYTYLESGDL